MCVSQASRTLDDQVGAEDSHAANPDTGLSGTIGSSEAGENDGGRAAQRTKEGLEISSQQSHWVAGYNRRCGGAGWNTAM